MDDFNCVTQLIINSEDQIRLSCKIAKNTFDFDAVFQTLIGGLISTLIGVYLAYRFTSSHEKNLSKSQSINNIASNLLEVLEEFEAICFDYWGSNYDNKNDPNLEVLVQSRMRRIRRQFKILLKISDIQLQNKPEIEKTIGLLFDTATGGDFGSKIKKKSNGRIFKISGCCDKLAYPLFVLRIS